MRDRTNHLYSRQASSAAQLQYGSKEDPIDVSSDAGHYPEHEHQRLDTESEIDALMTEKLRELDSRKQRLKYRKYQSSILRMTPSSPV